MEPVQIILIALIVFLVAGIGLFIAMNSSSGQKKKSQIELIRGSAGTEIKSNEKDIQNKRRAEMAKKLKSSKEDDVVKDKKKISMDMKLGQAGLNITTGRFWLLSMFLSIVLMGASYVMGMTILSIILIGITGFLGLPRFILFKLIKRRQKRFLAEFSDALDATVRLLKAGMPVSEAIKMISREFDGPVGEEMGRVYDKQKIGIPLHEAALEGTRRMPLTEMQMFATGLAIQSQTGSSLSEVLSNLSGVIRARFRLKRKIMALSSEAIASASIIGALPPVVAFGLWFVNPGYLDPLFTTGTGKAMLVGAGMWMGLGILVMKQMINFKI
jgi:tight adherence protein B